MSAIQNEAARKAASLREFYGTGYLTATQLGQELGMKRQAAAAWAKDHALGVNFGARVRYDVDALAKVLVGARGYC